MRQLMVKKKGCYCQGFTVLVLLAICIEGLISQCQALVGFKNLPSQRPQLVRCKFFAKVAQPVAPAKKQSGVADVTPKKPSPVADVTPSAEPDWQPEKQSGIVDVKASAWELDIGQEVMGTITEVNNHGAIVDIGMDRHGWLAKASFQEERVENMADVADVGDRIKARVAKVDSASVGLSIRDLPQFHKLPVSAFTKGDVLEGTVVSTYTDKYGRTRVYFDIGAMVNAFAEDRKRTVKKGEKTKVTIANVDRHGIMLKPLSQLAKGDKPLSQFAKGDVVEGTVGSIETDNTGSTIVHFVNAFAQVRGETRLKKGEKVQFKVLDATGNTIRVGKT